MPQIADICRYLDELCPPRLAENWDNVGLLVGRDSGEVRRIMTCLTVTPDSAREAAESDVDLVVAHHPMPFHAQKRLTSDSSVGRLLLEMIEHRVAIYSPHTAFDSAAMGINQNLAAGLGIREPLPLEEDLEDPRIGTGRWGPLDESLPLDALESRLKEFLRIDHLRCVGSSSRVVKSVAVGCGAAGELLELARRKQCDVFVTGEMTFHGCLEAEASDMALLLPGHYASERFAVELLADWLRDAFPAVQVWASRRERDPLRWA